MTDIIIMVTVCILSGLGAGVATGFAGLSAAVFISPMLIVFLKLPAYEAVGISLAADVLASALSACHYGRHGNLDLKRGRILMITVIGMTIVGSIVSFFVTSSDTGNSVMSFWMIVASLLLGLRFVIAPQERKREHPKMLSIPPVAISLVAGAYIGFICGFQGTGGGMMMFFVLTALLKFDFKKAVGTSVFIMAFTALIGAVAHFVIKGVPDLAPLIICVMATLVGAQIAARAANYMSGVALKRATGILLTVSGVVMLVVRIWF